MRMGVCVCVFVGVVYVVYVHACVCVCPSPIILLFSLLHNYTNVLLIRRWELTALEKCLLSTLVHSLAPASSYEIPVYLPVASNKTAYRLLIFQLMESIKVAVLCAPEPSLELALSHVVRFWSIVGDNLKTLSHSLPRNLPLALNLESSILAFLIMNAETHKCLSSFHLSSNAASQRSFLSPGIKIIHTLGLMFI